MPYVPIQKPCYVCGSSEKTALARVKEGRTYINGICRECERDRTNAHRRANLEKNRARIAKYRKETLGESSSKANDDQKIVRAATVAYNKEWRAQNKDKVNGYYVRRRDSGLLNYYNANRRAAKKQATPGWADLDAIRDVYQEAQYMQMHVDHIYPLQSDWVCGLHLWDNLQLLDPITNIKKGNRVAIYEDIS